MIDFNTIKSKFIKNGGVLKSSELKKIGLSSRQIGKLLANEHLEKIKYGYYTLNNYFPKEEVIIARLYPDAVIFLQSALKFYNYFDRIPQNWEIAVQKHSNPNKYNISYLKIKPYYITEKYRQLGIESYDVDNVKVKIYDRDKSICDLIRYQDKLDSELFTTALKKYINDEQKNVNSLIAYAKKMKIREKVENLIGVWI